MLRIVKPNVQTRIKVDFHDLEATLLPPLYGRAKFSRAFPSIFNDEKAIELVDQIDYDISIGLDGMIASASRAKQFDDKIRAYLSEHPRATVINVGAGLDTTFYRVDNASIHWYDLDLPNVIDKRRRLLPERDRITYLAGSLFDAQWCDRVTDKESGVFMLAGGVFDWFDEPQVKLFFSLLADNFPGAEIVLNAESRLATFFTNRGFRQIGIRNVRTKWAMKDARKMEKWDKRITVQDQFSGFKNFPRDPVWGVWIERWMNFSDRNRMHSVFHIRV
jgi:O-methyltransferase involved in polyketide biosynthesis